MSEATINAALSHAGPDDFLTLPQAAAYLDVSQTTMRRYATADESDPRRVPSSKTGGGHFRFQVKDLDSYIQEQEMASA